MRGAASLCTLIYKCFALQTRHKRFPVLRWRPASERDGCLVQLGGAGCQKGRRARKITEAFDRRRSSRCLFARRGFLLLLRKQDIFLWLYLPLILLLCVAYTWRPLGGGYDFWAHAAVGRWIWDHAQVPTRSLFLWSADDPWVAHSWLSQLFFYGLMAPGELLFKGRGLGPYIVEFFTLAMVLLPFALLWKLWRRQATSSIFKPLLFALAIWCSAPRFQPRQELFTALFLVVLLAYLIAWSQNRMGDAQSLKRSPDLLDPASLGIVLMFVLWVNLHALFALGLLLLVLTVVCDAIQDRFDARSQVLLGVALVCLAATLLNPFGINIWRAALQLKTGNMADYIDEWKPPLWALKLWPYVAGECVLLLASVFAWRRNPQRRWSQAAWLVVGAVLFLRSRRFLWLLSLLALAVMAANARSFDTWPMWSAWKRFSRQPEGLGVPWRLQGIARAGVILILVFWIAKAIPYDYWPWRVARVAPLRWTMTYHRVPFPPRAVSRYAPEGAATFIETRNLQGRMFNDYENSSYLQWRLNGPVTSGPRAGSVLQKGRRGLYIDLLNAYPDGPDGLLMEYFEIMSATARGLQVLDQKRVAYIVLGAHKWDSSLATYLNGAGKTRWTRVYNRIDGQIWTRRANTRTIAQPKT